MLTVHHTTDTTATTDIGTIDTTDTTASTGIATTDAAAVRKPFVGREEPGHLAGGG